jgi:metalloendopeptidase OMA1, mitochondrial
LKDADISSDIPANFKFIQDDALKGEWGSKSYSYIHTRMLLGCFEDFRQILKTAYNNLEPEGWLESQELYPTLYCEDGSLHPDDPFADYTKQQDQAAMNLRRPLRIANKLKRWYEEAGFINVREEIYTLPINGWPSCPTWKMLGRFWCRITLDSLPAFTYRSFHAAFGWNQMETEMYLINVKKAIKNQNTHAYQKV